MRFVTKRLINSKPQPRKKFSVNNIVQNANVVDEKSVSTIEIEVQNEEQLNIVEQKQVEETPVIEEDIQEKKRTRKRNRKSEQNTEETTNVTEDFDLVSEEK